MNSYPQEFLAHPQPLMFIAGLAEAGPLSNRDRSSSIISSTGSTARGSRAHSLTNTSNLDPSSAAGSVGMSLTSPLTSPRTSGPNPLPTSPMLEATEELKEEEEEEVVEVEVEEGGDERDREFQGLIRNLRGALDDKGARGKVWVSNKNRKDFRIILVEKSVRLPLRKVVAPRTSTDSPHTPHSPLSPLNLNSPLHPDGLIAPVWIRKHAELVPSVFVLFLRLWEPPISPQDENEVDREIRVQGDREREREHDDLLVREIGERRRRLGERGIKLTVVLMASAETLDSPSLDPRLSYLRRASALSAKASLFVLTPVPADQLPHFVQSLQDALYDSAMEYYGTHGKRVRRKRARVPSTQFGMTSVPAGKVRPLGSQGWAVRYDFKSGWFAEIRGEMEVARRHYEDCWNELARMFASTQTLPPRTKRWAEAKVLADCVAIRICRILLYEGAGSKVTGPFFVHLTRFSDLSRGWGIGEETFEYWSWIARQYRIFAELLDLAITSGLELPPFPTPTFPASAPASVPPPFDHLSTPESSCNPFQILQQPAFYYYTAATCSIQRQLRYVQALEMEQDALSSEAGATSGYVATAPGFANEKKVDHTALVVELFTRAYSLLKEQDISQNRAALYVASRIAETYSHSGQYDMAIRFFERISSTFKIGKWHPIVRQMRSMWYECAQRTGNVELAARLLIEMMCPESGVEGEDKAALPDDLLSLLRTTAPSSPEPIVIDMEHSPSLLDVRAGFWTPTVNLPSPAPFQLQLTCHDDIDLSALTFQSLHVGFSDNRPDAVVNASTDESDSVESQIDLGTISAFEAGETPVAPLRWSKRGSIVLAGHLLSEDIAEVQITNVKLVMKEGSWEIHLVHVPGQLNRWLTTKGSITPLQDLSPSVAFTSQPHSISLEIENYPSAFIDEVLPMTVKLASTDDRTLDLRLSAFLQPSEEDDGATIKIGDEESRSLIKDVSLGSLAPFASIEKIVYLKAPRPGAKVVDISVHSTDRNVTLVEGDDDRPSEEKALTAVVSVLLPFECTSTTKYRQVEGAGGSAMVTTVVTCPSPRQVHTENLEMRPVDGGEVELKSCSLSGNPDDIPKVWDQTTTFAICSQFSLQAVRRPSLSGVQITPPSQLVFTWKSADATSYIETIVLLPPLALLTPESTITAHLTPPTLVHLHRPFTLPLTLSNSHPTRSLGVSIEVFTAESFVWEGNRAMRLADLAPGQKRTVEMKVVAVSATGWCTLPKVVVWEEGEGEREEVNVKDGRGGNGVSNEGFKVFVRP